MSLAANKAVVAPGSAGKMSPLEQKAGRPGPSLACRWAQAPVGRFARLLDGCHDRRHNAPRLTPQPDPQNTGKAWTAMESRESLRTQIDGDFTRIQLIYASFAGSNTGRGSCFACKGSGVRVSSPPPRREARHRKVGGLFFFGPSAAQARLTPLRRKAEGAGRYRKMGSERLASPVDVPLEP